MRRAKRIAVFLVFALMLQSLTGFCGTPSVRDVSAAGASYRIEGTVTADYLNLRAGVGPKTSSLGTLVKGQKVTVIGSAKNTDGAIWYKLETTLKGKTVTGYALSKYIVTVKSVPDVSGSTNATATPTKKTTATPTPAKKTATPTAKASPTPTPVKQNGTGSQIATVTTTRMNVRSRASGVADVLGKVYQGDRLTVVGTEKDSSGRTWYRVEVVLDGVKKTGYVFGDYVKVTGTASTPTPTNTPTPKATATPTPKPTATPTQEPKKSATPTPTPKSAESTQPDLGKSTGQIATVTTTRMNVRNRASGVADVLGKVYQGDQLTVLGTEKDSSGRTWYRVEVVLDGVKKTGYVFGDYVKVTGSAGTPTDTKTETPTKTTTPEPTPVPKTPPAPESTKNTGTTLVSATVTSSKLNVRTGPGTEYAKVVQVSSGQKVTVISFAYADTGTVWYKIALTVNGCEYCGYVFGSYISLSEKYQLTDKNNSGSLHYKSAESVDTSSGYAAELRAAGFPESYIPYLLELHAKHPTWRFKAYQTGISWSDAIEGENTLGNNLIEQNKGESWLSYMSGSYSWSSSKFKSFDGREWMMINSAGLQYFMDPRNWLDDTYIFMFEDLTYDPETQTIEGVEKILKGTEMAGASFTYTDDSGNKKTISYAQAFMDAAKYSGVSPYHLASRAKQEVTSGGKFSKSVTGDVAGFEGYYNFYNIGAYNSTAALGAIKNGLKFSKYGGTNASLNKGCKIPWDNKYDAIVGGAYYIGSTYIRKGQNTAYLQKYNVTKTNTYTHQYMSNAQAPRSESVRVAQAYRDMGVMDTMTITFSIPVYKNMPSAAVKEPAKWGNPNPYLSSLKVTTTDGTKVSLSETFKSDTFEYTVTVPAGCKTLKIEAGAAASATKIYGTGAIALSGKNEILVVTTIAENGTKMNYRISVKVK